MKKQEYVLVPIEWIEELNKLAQKAKKENPSDPSFTTTRLIGYANSAESLLKYNERVKK